jgi:hypothetical protein
MEVMMRHDVFALLVPAALAAMTPAAAAPEKAKKIDWKDAKPVGKPQDCVPLMSIRETRVRDDQTIDFYLNGSKVLRNTLPHSCPQLGFEERFTYSTSLSQLCSTDIITVLVSPGISRGASCGLGQFQEVTGAPK